MNVLDTGKCHIWPCRASFN